MEDNTCSRLQTRMNLSNGWNPSTRWGQRNKANNFWSLNVFFSILTCLNWLQLRPAEQDKATKYEGDFFFWIKSIIKKCSYFHIYYKMSVSDLYCSKYSWFYIHVRISLHTLSDNPFKIFLLLKKRCLFYSWEQKQLVKECASPKRRCRHLQPKSQISGRFWSS
jgi:hypothetical protein